MRTLRASSFALAILVSSAPAASAATIFLPGVTQLAGWNDVNKTSLVGNPDSVLCWAATASNVLSYTGWWGWDGVQYLDTATEIYQTFDANWTNRTGAPTFAYEWWMTDRPDSIIENPPGTSVYTFDSPGRNFYPGVDVQQGASVTAFVPVDVPGNDADVWINQYITDQRGTAMAITINNPNGGGTYGHVVTVWGWDGATNTVYFTDSDDAATALRSMTIFKSGNLWYLNDYTNAYTTSTDALITDITRLNRNVNPFIEPVGAVAATVPEPATLSLLGVGLVAAFRRRRSR